MEAERKRKRASEKSPANIADRQTEEKQVTASGTEEDAAGTMPPPSEAEVEEFFLILRRMHVAVKYFGQRARAPPSTTADGRDPTAMEIGVKKGENTVRNGGLKLDLNFAPETERNNEL